jgi:hypothetical protein
VFKIVSVGTIVIDISSMTDNQETLFAPADQVFKILMQGVTMGATDDAIQLFRTDPELQGDLNKRGAGYGGNVAGAYIGTSGETGAQNTQNIPLWIDDTCGLRLECSGAMGSNMVNVTYMRVQ